MFAEIINKAITTSAWAEIKPVGSYPSCTLGIQAVDDTAFKLSLTGSDSDPYWTVKENNILGPGTVRLEAGVRLVYAKAITADTTLQIAVKRR